MENPFLSNDEINFADYVKVILRRKKMILMIFFSFLVGGVLYSLSLPKVYQATALIFISPRDANKATITFSAHRMLLKTTPVLERIVKTLGLDNGPGNHIFLEDLAQKLSIIDVAQTNIFQLTAQDPDPRRAMNLANTWAREYIQYNQELISVNKIGQSDFLLNQLEIAKKSLVYAEKKVVDFKSHFKVEFAQAELEIRKQNLSTYKTELMDLEITSKTQEDLLKELKDQIAKQEEFIVTSKAISDDALWQEHSRGRDLAGQKLRSEAINPIYQKLKIRIVNAEMACNMNKPKREYLRQLIANTEKETNDFAQSVNEKQIELNQLARDVVAAQMAYEDLSLNEKEARFNKAAQLEEVKLISMAYPPQHPVATSRRKVVIFAAFLGGVTALLAAFLIEASKTILR